MKKRIIFIGILIAVGIIGLAFAVNATEKRKGETAFQESVLNLDEYLVQNETEDSREAMADALNEIKESAAEVGADEVKSVLESGQYSDEAKIMMLESLYDGEDLMDGETTAEIFHLILDDTMDSEVRIALLRFAQDDEVSKDVLEELLMNENDESVEAQVIKQYYEIDQEAAAALVLEQIQTTESEKMVKSYLCVLSSAVVDGYVDKQEAIAICKTFLDNGTEDTAMAAGFALGDMYDIEALGILLDSNVDDIVKIGCVEQNDDTLMECLSNAPTEEEIHIIISAMQSYPITEVIDLLEKNVTLESDKLEVESLKEQPSYKKIDKEASTDTMQMEN